MTVRPKHGAALGTWWRLIRSNVTIVCMAISDENRKEEPAWHV